MSKSRDIADSAATINYIDGLTSDAQGQLNDKATLDGSPTFTGTVTATAFSGDGSSLTGVDSLPSQTGNNGLFLTTDGSTASWAEAGGGAWELISTTTASNSATVDIEDFSSTYDDYKIIITNLDPATNNTAFQLIFKISGSYLTSSVYDYWYLQGNSSSNTASGSGGASTSAINLSRPMNSSQNPNFFELSLFDTNSTNQKGVVFNGVLKNAYAYTSFGVATATSSNSALQGARFFFSSGNVNQGTFKLYGIKKS